MKLNLAECFFQKAEGQPSHPLIVGPDAEEKTSYAEFYEEVQCLAQQLQDVGVNRGSNIGVQYPSGREYIAFVYAIWACGACVTPIPRELTIPEKQQIFQHIYIDAVISSADLLDQLSTSIQPDHLSLAYQARFAKTNPVGKAPPQLAEINPAFIRFTSGTTGDAKGVVLSHESVYARIHAANQALQLNEDDRILWLLSMDYHFTVSIVAYLTFGATIILPKNSFGVTLLNAAMRHKATVIYGSPTHYHLMIQDETGACLPNELRLAIVTTTALRAEIADIFYARFGRVLNETYGIIELGLPAINVSNLYEKQGAVGRVLTAYELRLDCPPEDDQGEIMLRSSGMLDAYYSPWKSRDAVLQQNNGWFRTGDLGRLDEDGFLYIVGRIKELISVGGMKFFPDEVESVLECHPAIQAASVFGVQAGQWGEKVVAHLVLETGNSVPTEGELKAFCKQSLTTHKIPGSFQWIDQLAYTASGKKIRNSDKLQLA